MRTRHTLVVLGLFAAVGSLRAQTAEQTRLERTADSLFGARSYPAAVAAYRRLATIDSSNARYWSQAGMASALAGEYSRALDAFLHASANRGGPAAVYNVGAMYARLGNADSAFAWLTRAVQIGFADVATLSKDDDLVSLRGDARFAALRTSIGHPPAPCENDSLYRRFDFWIGEWKVTTAGGTQVGTSHIDRISGGCALLENWRDMRGSEGKSINTYDPVVKQWRQFWVGQVGGLRDYARSEWDGRRLSFYSDAPASGGQPASIIRLSFQVLEPDVVQQHGEVSRDAGKTWTTTYDFRYHRVSR
jgi:tetratricopeptide (TPR) repeat protein